MMVKAIRFCTFASVPKALLISIIKNFQPWRRFYLRSVSSWEVKEEVCAYSLSLH